MGKLPRGQAFVWMDGGASVKLRTPLPLPTPESGEALPASIEHLAQAMAARYEQAYGEGEDEPSRPALTVAGKGHGF